jgi:integrase
VVAVILIYLRWTGLRASDARQLQWKHVHVGRGSNGEIEILTQKRSKVAIFPLSTELRDDLDAIRRQRKPHTAKIMSCSIPRLAGPSPNAPF